MLSSFLKPQARGSLELELAQSHQHSTQQGLQDDLGSAGTEVGSPPTGAKLRDVGDWGFKSLLFLKDLPPPRLPRGRMR